MRVLIAALLLGNPSHYPQQNVRELNGTASTNAIGLGAALTLLRKTGAEHSSRQLAVEAMIQHTFDITIQAPGAAVFRIRADQLGTLRDVVAMLELRIGVETGQMMTMDDLDPEAVTPFDQLLGA